jgi:UDP:flavonoid glycosyltransferase YjiC (YdhE family)
VAQVHRHCSHAVVDGHNHRTHALLLAGKPLLLLPTALAQRMTARRVEDLGAGLVAGSVPGPGAGPVEPLAPLLRRLVDDPSLAAAALAFSARHDGHDDDRSLAATQALGTALMDRTRPRLMPE